MRYLFGVTIIWAFRLLIGVYPSGYVAWFSVLMRIGIANNIFAF
jgi:hypothetical protein